MSKYKYNKDYFNKIDTAEKAYWLGFLYADGCINELVKNGKTQSMNLELTLADIDKEHIVKFAQAIETNVPIKQKIITHKGKQYISNRIIISSTKMCKDLCDLKCVPNKTYNVRLPDATIIPNHFMRDFLRGFFDGDGCIHNKKNQTGLSVSFSGMECMLKDIVEFLVKNKIINVIPKIYKDKRSNACSFFIYGNNNSRDFLDYIYKDSTVYLDRKYQLYISYYVDFKPKSRKGVYFDKHTSSYVATISINNKRKVLGHFKTIEDAIATRKNAEIEKMKLLNCRHNQ